MHLKRTSTLSIALVLIMPGITHLSAQTLTVLHTFTNAAGAAPPVGGLLLSGRTLYGATGASSEGHHGNGTIFAVNTDGTGFTNLHSFSAPSNGTNSDGAHPNGYLVLGGNALYGTTYDGGSSGRGTVFRLNPDGISFTNLYNFSAISGTGGAAGTNLDGANPAAGLELSNDTLYGTAFNGGSAGCGVVFAVNTDGTGFTNLHSFTGAGGGASPYGGVILVGNTLHGAARNAGSGHSGTLFQINTDGTGFTNLYSFSLSQVPNLTNSDGAYPFGPLLYSSGTIYGAASSGGDAGEGVVYRIGADGNGFTNLHSFSAMGFSGLTFTNADGVVPGVPLLASGDTLYGTAQAGGSSDNGTIFKLNADDSGFLTLYHFSGGADGAIPVGNLVLADNTLYGIACWGGDYGNGTVFALSLAIPLEVQLLDNAVVLSWVDPAFHLQAAPDPSGVYINVPGATSPYTNSFADAQMFFRLKSD